MREILFRGKRTDNGEWVETKTLMCVKDVDGSEEAFYIAARNPMIQYDDKFGNIGILETGTSNPIFYKVIPETVGQYTGLTDKNGKKIFEGDVVKSILNYHVSEVYFSHGKFTQKCKCHDEDFTDIHCDILEVIGNIHDNPESLKGGA